MRSNSLHEKDIAHHIHPFTDIERHLEQGPFVIEKGDGIYVIDAQGNRYIEGVSGLWSAALGFSETRLVDAAINQMRQLPYYHSFSHKAHAPAIELASEIATLAPGRLNHVHFTSSGSEANDTVVKMVWYLNNALGRPKKKTFLARLQGYHGSTVAAGSLTGIPKSHKDFDLPAIPVRHLTCPHFYREGQVDETEQEFVARLGAEMEAVIAEEGAETIAAFIGEPLMGAGGVYPPPKGYWEMVQSICRKHDILIIMDEIITGFGRLGTMFGSEKYDIKPDIMVLSKQLTSSYQPLAAVVVSDSINDVLVRHAGKLGSFVHGFTATGHPVATAVGLENIRIIQNDGLIENARKCGELLQSGLRRFMDHPLVGEVRGDGFVGAVELVANKETRSRFEPYGSVGAYLFERAHEYGLIVRAIYDTIVFCPPLITTPEQVGQLLSAFSEALDDTTAFVSKESIV